MHHEKTVFVIVKPKEGWARVAAPISFFWYDTDFSEFDSADIMHGLYSGKVGVMPKGGWARPCAPILLLV